MVNAMDMAEFLSLRRNKILFLLPVGYNISPLSMVTFSNCTSGLSLSFKILKLNYI
jgi:hypothetical protein